MRFRYPLDNYLRKMKVTETKSGKYVKHQVVIPKELSVPLEMKKGDDLQIINVDNEKKEFTLRLVKKVKNDKKK